ncbi:MAG: hypothetical protein PHW95_00055 [Patescibacteria group bacterium]|nr:hypothetical protein [Patescibacteria group bacterium]
MPYLSHNYRSPKKSRLRTLKEAGVFFGFSMLAIMLTLFILGWAAYALQSQAATGINQQLNYQGKLMTASGVQVANTNYNFRFRIYNASSGGTVLWTERWTATSTQITTVNGVFSAALGSINALSNGSIDWNSDSLYLQVDLDADNNGSWEESFATRKRLTSTPYAFNANQVNGFSATSTAAVADYNNAIETEGTGVPTEEATAIDLTAGFINNNYNTFTLNAAGLSWV